MKSVDHLPKPASLTDEEWKWLAASGDDAKTIPESARAHVQRYLAINGEDGHTMKGIPLPVLLLITIGRKNGSQVTAPVNFHKREGIYHVVGSMPVTKRNPTGN